ncbi:TonB-dependent receptor [Bowmanella denitrificans]|uniref:TonB-dependent receptor n=1 Tax=Bowmanella denitrificans TaxID=366582 RepID=A0ABP3GAG3_9ALTE
MHNKLAHFALSALAMGLSQAALANDDATSAADNASIDEIVVVGQKQTFATSHVSQTMIERQAAVASVNDVLNELPGVLVTQGDYFGASDWLTAIFMRGFNTGGGANQIGTTIDGLPNGGSSYGGGSKANRYIDVLELETVEVGQGTADISSRSNEALGGTLNFITRDPLNEQAMRLVTAFGDQDARKYYFRYDTGEIAANTHAFVSASSSSVKDWINNASTVTRDYGLAKITSEIDGFKLTGFISYNDANEHEFETISLQDYNNNPRNDALHMTWTDIPAVNEYYRDGWRALRENTFAYAKVEKDFGDWDFQTSVYKHRMKGRGDWVPPYLVNIKDDGEGAPQSEFLGGETQYGGKQIDRFYFVNPDGSAAIADENCVPTHGFSKDYDPACYADNVLPVMSYRHSHYTNDRLGLTADVAYHFSTGSIHHTVRGGIWFEDGESSSTRDWHKISNVLVGPAFDAKPYWVQYISEYQIDEFMYYLEEVAEIGDVTARLGVKKFKVDTDYHQPIGQDPAVSNSSSSDPLISFGLNYITPLPGLEVFAGYSENFSAISKDRVGGSTSEELSRIEAETAENIEVGLRYEGRDLQFAMTYYDIAFENRIVFIEDGAVTGIDYLSQVDGVYYNLGGIDSNGLEMLASYNLGNGFSLSGSYTYNKATFVGTGSAALDKEAKVVPGNRVHGSPKSQFVLAADYMGEMMSAGMSLRFVGDRYINYDNAEVAPSYTVSDLYVGVDLANLSDNFKGLSARLNVNNLFDQEFISGVYSGAVFPAAPRTVTLSLTADF